MFRRGNTSTRGAFEWYFRDLAVFYAVLPSAYPFSLSATGTLYLSRRCLRCRFVNRGKGRRFAPSYFVLLAVVFAFGAVVAVATTGVLILSGRTLQGVISYRFLYLLCVLYVWSMLSAGLLRAWLSFYVGPSGIHGRTFWGRARYLKWSDVGSADLLGPPFGRMLRIHSAQGGLPLWLPLFVRHRAELVNIVGEYTFEGHPILSEIGPKKPRA